GVKLGGLNAKGIANREEAKQRAEALRPVLSGLAGMSHRRMAAELNAMGVQTPAGGQWHAVTVKRVLERLGNRINLRWRARRGDHCDDFAASIGRALLPRARLTI